MASSERPGGTDTLQLKRNTLTTPVFTIFEAKPNSTCFWEESWMRYTRMPSSIMDFKFFNPKAVVMDLAQAVPPIVILVILIMSNLNCPLF
ncbi:hypothetical protein MHB56_00475 [Paenibacillus sp. FSL H8-0315]